MRPRPKLITAAPLPGTDLVEEVTEAIDAAVYAVVHSGRPIGIRRVHPQIDGAKYVLTSYPNKGHAFRLAARLNHTHKTTAFAVLKMTRGEIVEPVAPVVVRPRRAPAPKPPTRRR